MAQVLEAVVKLNNVNRSVPRGDVGVLLEPTDHWIEGDLNVLNINIGDLSDFVVKDSNIICYLIYGEGTMNDVKFTHAHQNAQWVVQCKMFDFRQKALVDPTNGYISELYDLKMRALIFHFEKVWRDIREGIVSD